MFIFKNNVATTMLDTYIYIFIREKQFQFFDSSYSLTTSSKSSTDLRRMRAFRSCKVNFILARNNSIWAFEIVFAFKENSGN